MTGARRIAFIAFAAPALAACGRSEESAAVASARPLPSAEESTSAAPPALTSPSGSSGGGVPEHDRLDPFGFDAASIFGPMVVRETRIVDGGPIPPDPDDAIKDAARVSAAGCFHDLPAGGPSRRSATITVYVIPTGTVSRAEVRSSDTNDPRVLACLKTVGSGLKFTEKPEIAAGARRSGSRTAGATVASSAPSRPSIPVDGASAGLRTYAIEVTVVAAAH